jgi:Cof subfamily protein (haloacid dehalogenase superfamily)
METSFPFDIVAVDIDGTLITRYQTLSPRTRTAINQLVAEGVQLVLASARMPRAIYRVIGNVHPVTPCIALNGAIIYHIYEGVIIPTIKHTLALPLARQIAQDALARGMTLCTYVVESRWYASTWNSYVTWEANASGIPPSYIGTGKTLLSQPPTKLLLYAETPTLAGVMADTLRQTYGDAAEIVVSDPICIEVTAAGVSKGAALSSILAKSSHTDPRVLAIGDGLNDLPMFALAKTSVAMGNAPLAVQQYADRITATCDEDGVAQALEELGLQK